MLLAREAIGLALAAEEQGARLFAQGIQSTSPLSCEETLDDDSKKQLTRCLHAALLGCIERLDTAIAGGRIKGQSHWTNRQESQYIEARSFPAAGYCPDLPHTGCFCWGSQNGKTATFASAEQFFLSYVKHTVSPWIGELSRPSPAI